MARAKLGGTSAKLRGVVGDYIYQIIRNPQGYSEQKVIAYTKEKYNRNTRYQALARMQITMFMNCMRLLTPIISDSFEGLRSTVNSCNRFVQINMPLIQDYCVYHWRESLACMWPRKGNGNHTFFPFWISEGSYSVPMCFSYDFFKDAGWLPQFSIDLSGTFSRKIDLRKKLGFQNGDSINVIYWLGWGHSILIANVQLNPMFNDMTVITDHNCRDLFLFKYSVLQGASNQPIEAEEVVHYSAESKRISFTFYSYARTELSRYRSNPEFFAYIFSRRKGNLYQRNTCRFIVNDPDGDEVDFGEPPCDAYRDWDSQYNDEDYDDYFVR